ncbi:MAG TPA: two-component regulator propeller domain-containing protein [Ignavibacteriaceae bacterium]|nr:two-component regulator propeller domain-containing protein [Ignavibacteriaceae bacterium]
MKYIIFFVLITVSFCFAQTISHLLPQEQFRKFHKLNVDDGLSQNLVTFIHQDNQGFLWFGTAGGLDRFDGIEFKTYRNIKGINKQPVYFFSCIENSDSTFWISTEFGLMLFDPITISAEMFVPSTSQTQGMGSKDIHSLTKINDSTLLLGITGKGLFKFDINSKKFSIIYDINSMIGRPAPDIVGIIPKDETTVFVITNNQVLLYNHDTQSIKPIAEFPRSILANCAWFNKEIGSVLIGTTNGVFEFQNNILTPLVFPGMKNLKQKSLSVHAIHKDSKGMLWLGMENEVIAIDDEKGVSVLYKNNPSDPSSILQGAVLGFFEDRSENLWIRIQDRGVCRVDLKKEKFSTITNHPGYPKQLEDPMVRDITIDKNNNLWIAGNGITFIDQFNKKAEFHFSSSPNNLYAYNTRQIYSLKDNLLAILANKKIYIYNTLTSEAKELRIDGFEINNVYRAFVRSRTGNLICVTKESIFEIDAIQRRFIKTLINFSEQLFIPSIAVVDDFIEDANGNLWIGTSHGLLYRNELQNSFQLFSDTSKHTIILPEPTVTSLAISDEEILWIGTTAGLYKYDLHKQTIKGYHVKDGLPNDKIWSIAVDKKGGIWATSNRGLIRLQELPDGKFLIRSYSIDDGLPSNEFNMAVVATDSKGVFYFGTPNGIVYFHPDSVVDNPNNSPIVITDFKINGVSIPTENEISFTNEIQIPYEKKVFSLRYALLDFTDPLRTQYQYKLDGYDDRWIQAGKRREAIYTNLDPGKYTLLIKATNSDGVWIEKPFSIIIEIIPPFWMTWWFRVIIILSLIGIVGSSVRYLELKKIKQKIKKLEEKQALEKERTRIARDMHDEIGANLTRISILSGIINSQSDKEKNDVSLNQITHSVNETIEKLDEIVWAVNPSNDNLKNLTAYISEYAENFFDASEIKCRFSLPDTIDEINLTSEKRHHLFLIIKEALNNVLKYSQARRVTISLIIESSFFTLTIKDDGIGFSPESISSTGNGIKNMKERISLIDGEFELISAAGEGSEIRLKIFI